MSTPYRELAEAVTADLNSPQRGWSFGFTAERTHVPVWIGELDLAPGKLQCFVSPWADVQSEALDKQKAKFTFELDFGFAMRLVDMDSDTVDDLQSLVHTAVTRYIATNFVVNGLGRFVPLRRTSMYFTHSPEHLNRGVGDDGKVHYTGDFLSVFRVPYLFVEAD